MTEPRTEGGLLDLLDNQQMPDNATPRVTLGELRGLCLTLDVERLALLTDFVEWANEWLEEKERREAWPMMPGTMPPASFAERPAALNRELALLRDRGARLTDEARPALGDKT